MNIQDLQKSIEDLQTELESLKKRQMIFESHDHFQTGGAPLKLKNLINFGTSPATINLKSSEAAANDMYDTFFIADFGMEIIAAEENHTTAGTDGNPVTLDVYKLTPGQLLANGVSVLSTTFDLKSTAKTPVRVTATTIRANRILKQGDRLNLKLTGTPTSLANMSCLVYFLPL